MNHTLRGAVSRCLYSCAAADPENHMLSVSRFRAESEKLPRPFDGFRILLLSDLHGRTYGRENTRLLRKIETEKPDLVAVTGDVIDRSVLDCGVFLRLAEKIAPKYPVYFVMGNHELYLDPQARRDFLDRLGTLGVRVLDNESAVLERGGSRVTLYGLWYPLKYYREARGVPGGHRKFGPEQMRAVLGACAGDGYSILLAHNPIDFDTYAAWGADLTLSGHVHGGMIRLPLLGGLLSPERRFFPEYCAGLYEKEGKKLLVSRGLGSGIFSLRIGNRPELVTVTLTRPETP